MNEKNNQITITEELLDKFLKNLKDSGRAKETLRSYRRVLADLKDFSQGKEITKDLLDAWITDVKSRGYCDRTLDAWVTPVNGYLRFNGRWDMVIRHRYNPGKTGKKKSMITRDDYKNFAASLDDPYRLIVKVIANVDITLIGLEDLTVEACKKGVLIQNGKEVYIPKSIAKECLAYAKHRKSGPVFLSRTGSPLDRSNITNKLSKLAKKNGYEGCTPRALHGLYIQIREQLAQEIKPAYHEMYDAIVEKEEGA